MSTEPEEQISADEEFDETIVVARPVDDATVVVARPVDDETIVVAKLVDDATIVVARPVDDETIVVASTRRARRDAETRSAGSAQKLAPAQDPASVHAPVAAQNQAAAQDLDVPDPAVPADATLAGAVAGTVDDALDDATVVVAQPPQIEDATIVVAPDQDQDQDPAPAPAQLQAQAPAQPQPQKSTRQRSSAWPGTSARSGTSAPPERSARPPRSAPADPEDDATRVVGRSAGRDPAPPVAEPEPEYSSAEFAKLMFKPPLDPRRRVKEAPFPQPEHTLPKRGVSQGMPVIFGARPEVLDELSSANLDLGRRLGAVPASTVMTPARREGLPSMALLNRKFRVLALAGGAGVCIVVGLGLWGIAALAFG